MWEFARRRRTPAALSIPQSLDWERVARLARANGLAALLARTLEGEGGGLLPAAALAAELARTERQAVRLSEALGNVLEGSAGAGIDVAVLKGLQLSVEVYGDASVRPGADIDLLVRKQQVRACLEVLESLGYSLWWPHLLDDRFYARHHLHISRCSRDLKTWFEVHWALDHPYTLLTVDYEGLMDRTSPAMLLGAPVRRLSVSDQLLSLSVHLVKHAVYLPFVHDRPDVRRIVLADGRLLNFLDVSEVIRKEAATHDWSETVTLARAWGAGPALGSVLRVCRAHLGSPVPEEAIDALPVAGARRVRAWAMEGMVGARLAGLRGGAPGGLWTFLLQPNAAFILRPIRLLELLEYVFPPREYLERRYGSWGWRPIARHAHRAFADVLRMGIDTVHFAMERRRRLRALNMRSSIFERMEPES